MKRHQPLHVHLPNLLFLVAIILFVLYLWSCIG
jgi:hypothetical protein